VTLGELLSDLAQLEPGLTIFVDASPDDWSVESQAILLREDVEDDTWKPPVGYRYFLEVDIASDVARSWSEMKGRHLENDEVARVVLHYARWDAWPAE
jgi:hypothetical protein